MKYFLIHVGTQMKAFFILHKTTYILIYIYLWNNKVYDNYQFFLNNLNK